jgi:hypothetical protein
MKDIIRKILREEVELDKKEVDQNTLNFVIRYFSMRTLPKFVCFSTIIKADHAVIILLQYNKYLYNPTDYEQKIGSEIRKILNKKNILVTGFYTEEKNCEERLENLKNSQDYNKKFFLVPNKNYNP